MTITQSRAEMSELGVKLTAEQQKVDRQMTINDQLGTQMREMQKELKVGPQHFSTFLRISSDDCYIRCLFYSP